MKKILSLEVTSIANNAGRRAPKNKKPPSSGGFLRLYWIEINSTVKISVEPGGISCPAP